MRLALVLALAACGYPHPTLSGTEIDAPVTIDDGATDAAIDAPTFPPDAKELTKFEFRPSFALSNIAYTGAIVGGAIAVHVFHVDPTARTALVATFSTTGKMVTVNGTIQVSGVTANDFSSPVVYTVVARDGTSRIYTVTMTGRDFAPEVDTMKSASDVIDADLDRDFKPDLVAGDSNVVFVNTMAQNATVPTFDQATLTTPGYISAVGDFNGDGVLDVAGGGQTGTAINITTSGIQAPLTFPVTSFSVAVNATTGIAAVDFDGDGKIDLAGQMNGTKVDVAQNTTTGGALQFAATTSFPVCTDSFALNFIAADVNGDGKPDLVDGCGGGISVRLNQSTPGSLAFSAEHLFPVGTVPFVTAADFDGDGRLDLISANYGTMDVSILLNTTPVNGTTPSFTAHLDFPVGVKPDWCGTGDFDGDGKLDLVTVNFGPGTASLLFNRSQSGVLAMTTAFDLPTTGNARTAVVVDLNRDGIPDLATAGQKLGVVLGKPN